MNMPVVGKIYRISSDVVASVRPNGYTDNGDAFYLVSLQDMRLVKITSVYNGVFDVHYIVNGAETFYGKQWSLTEFNKPGWFTEVK